MLDRGAIGHVLGGAVDRVGMRIGAILLLGLAAVLGATMPARAANLPALDELVTARLVAENATIAPGAKAWVAVHLGIKSGWHVYWRNPGDSGLPTTIEWDLPAGFTAGAIEWPVPERFVTGALVNYGYSGATDLLVPISAASAFDPWTPVQLRATVTWLACAEICIPGESKLALRLPAGGSAPAADPASAPLFAAARQRQPLPALFVAEFAAAAREYRLFIPAAASTGFERPTAAFFPFDDKMIEHAAEPRIEQREGGGIELVLTRAGGAGGSLPAVLDGVLVLTQAAGEARAYTISAVPAALPIEDTGAIAWWEAVLLAFLGGVVLNLMPCVFPILSIKVLSLSTFAHRADGHRHGLAYGAGVVLSFAALGGALLGLRAGGTAIGWGFQLQSPIVVGLLAYLLLAMGLSLSGVAEFGAGLAGAGSRLADRAGLAGAFATGVLATIVATPCTAPFMGAALGVAVIAPAPLALAVFIALGGGLAAPFVLATWLPGVAHVLPRPGPWMVLAKQILAFPLYATAAWLVWVLIQEVEPGSALAVLFGLVAIAFAVWVYGRTRLAAPAGRHIGVGLAAAGLAAAIVLAATVVPAGTRAPEASRAGLPYEAFTAARLAALAAERKPAFVNLTAAWCITCLVNERATLDSAAVRGAFAARGIVALKGDWTRQNPDITVFLQRYGRNGVPLYLLYDGRGETTILPQILTETIILDAVGRI